MSGIIRWEKPPPSRRNTGGGWHPRVHDWPAVAKVLRSKPDRWAVVAVCDNISLAGATAQHIRDATYAAFRSGVFEAVSRKVDGECRVYARFVGEPS